MSFQMELWIYKMIKGHTFTKSYIDKVDKEQLAKKLADFMMNYMKFQ